MVKVVFVRESKNAGYTVLGINAGEGAVSYTVETSLYMRIGAPLASDVIGEEHFSLIVASDEIFRATKKALAILSYSDNNCFNLTRKLKSFGFSRDAVEATVEDMLRHGYVNEQKQLERLILNEAKTKLTGRAKFIPKLIAKGYKRSDIESVTERLIESGEIDFDAIKDELIERRLGDGADKDEVKKLLYKSGFYLE